MVRKDVDEELSPARMVEWKRDGGEEGSRWCGELSSKRGVRRVSFQGILGRCQDFLR